MTLDPLESKPSRVHAPGFGAPTSAAPLLGTAFSGPEEPSHVNTYLRIPVEKEHF